MAEARPAEAPAAGPRRRVGRFAAFEAAVWAAVAALGLVQFVVHHPGLFRGRVQAALRELRAHRAGPRRERFVTLGADGEHAPGGGGLGGGGKGGPPAGDPVSMEPIPQLVEGFAPDRAASGTTLKWLSFWDENRYEPEDFRGWANFAFSKNMTTIRRGATVGLQHLLKVAPTFFERTPYSSELRGRLRLRANFTAAWQSLVDRHVAGLMEAGEIMGFQLGDELVWQGVDPVDVERAAREIRRTYPDTIIWYNEARGPLRGDDAHPGQGMDHYHEYHAFARVPPSVTWFSIDVYHTSPKANYTGQVRAFYENHIYPKLAPYQRAVLVPGSFGSEYSARCNLACYDAFATKDAWEFFQWGWDDDRVVGIAPYHWNSCPHCKRSHNEIGTKDLRLAKAAWRQIGERIGRAWAAGGGGCRRPYCSGEGGFGEIAALIPRQHGAAAPRPPGAFGHFGHVHRKKKPSGRGARSTHA